VAVSPGRVGAGQVLVNIANQTPRASFLTVRRRGGGRPTSAFGPIGAMSSSQTKLALSPGAYVVAARGLRSARLVVGPRRAGGDNTLLEP
jgi:hypothetical protein